MARDIIFTFFLPLVLGLHVYKRWNRKIHFSFAMDKSAVDKLFLKHNKNLGLLTGIWPFQRNRSKRIGRILVLIFITSLYITQLSRVAVFFSVNTILNDYPNITVTVGTIVKFGNYVINESKLRLLLGAIYDDWRTMQSKDECTIMAKYAKRGVNVIVLYMLHITVGVSLFMILPLTPPVLDLVVPLNESRKRLYLYPAYYFVDSDEHYYLIIAHMVIVVSWIGVVYCACDVNYLYAVQHACGLIAISGYRFKYACHTDNNVGDVSMLKNIMHGNVCHSIRGHQHALKYMKQIESSHYTCTFIVVAMLMACISVSLLKISESEHDAEWAVWCAFFVGQLFHMLVLTIQGQFVMNAYDDFYNTICEATWYNSTCKTQKLYMLVLRRSLNPPLLTAGGYLTLNLKTFTEIIKASVSYYTVMQTK